MITRPAIRVQGIEKSFKGQPVLRGVTFDVTAGSIFTLLGSNGAGKTTLVRILSTLLKADEGAATVHGFDVAGQPGDVREAISLTGQFAAVDEILTGRENLVLVAKVRHLDNPSAIADDLLDRFSLTDAGNRRAATYSGGTRRRLDLAMSLIGTPPIIFLDEPTTGLDPQARLEVWQTVKNLAGSGTTVLLTPGSRISIPCSQQRIGCAEGPVRSCYGGVRARRLHGPHRPATTLPAVTPEVVDPTRPRRRAGRPADGALRSCLPSRARGRRGCQPAYVRGHRPQLAVYRNRHGRPGFDAAGAR